MRPQAGGPAQARVERAILQGSQTRGGFAQVGAKILKPGLPGVKAQEAVNHCLIFFGGQGAGGVNHLAARTDGLKGAGKQVELAASQAGAFPLEMARGRRSAAGLRFSMEQGASSRTASKRRIPAPEILAAEVSNAVLMAPQDCRRRAGRAGGRRWRRWPPPTPGRRCGSRGGWSYRREQPPVEMSGAGESSSNSSTGSIEAASWIK